MICFHLLSEAPEPVRRKCRTGRPVWSEGPGINHWDAFTCTDQGVSQMKQSCSLAALAWEEIEQ